MPRSSNQKIKLLAISDIFRRETSEENPLSVPQLIDKLKAYDIEAERKSLYDDIEVLIQYGMDIVKSGSGRNTAYYLGSSEFEINELKLLADAVACSKFITPKKSNELIKKLGTLTNKYDAKELKRNIIVSDRVSRKSQNEKIYYNVDTIRKAIEEKKKIRFLYFDYNRDKKQVYHNDGTHSVVSPYALCWRDDNYYLVGYYDKYGKVSNFRVDKIEKAEIICDEEYVKQPDEFNLNEYTKSLFGMFGGEKVEVKFRAENSLSGVVFDRFGKETRLLPDGDDYFTFHYTVDLSPVFYGWVAQCGEKIEIISPEDVRNDFKSFLKNISKLYK